MLNKTINRGLTAAFIVAMTVSILFMILPLVDIGNEMSWLQTMKENSVNTSTWIITVVFGISSIKLRRPVLKREQYCFDPHFVDRVDERNLLYAFLQADGSTDNRLFVVKGGMCRGKTVLLQRFADDVNGFYNDQIHRKRGLLRKKYSAYYIAISSSAEDILTEIGKTLSPHGNLDTYEKVKTFLRKASYTKNTVLLIDNISRAKNHQATETAHKLLYHNPSLWVILSITEETPLVSSSREQRTLTPPLFGEMHINELAKTFHQKLTHRTNEEIIRISSGIPAYVVLLFRASILDRPTTLSNFENMQNIVQMQLNRLGEERDIAGYLACLKLCYDGMIQKAELMSLADVPELQLKSVFDAALAEERIINKQAYIFMNDLVAKCCLETINRRKYLPKICSFYEVRNPEIAIVASIIQGENLDLNNTMRTLQEAYERRKFLLFVKLGNLDDAGILFEFKSNLDLYNVFRFYYLGSLLQLGEYALAISTLQSYEDSNIPLPSLQRAFDESEFEFQYLIIDLHHLSNRFQLALGEIDSLLQEKDKLTENHLCYLLYLKAHCLKHLGNHLEEADYILAQMEHKKLPHSLYVKVLYSRLTIHMFWGDADFDYTSVLERIKGINQSKTPEWAHSLRHIATYEWLHTKSASNALEIIDSGLKVLEETRWRIIYDFYFEKAEWMRIQNENENKSIHPPQDILGYYEKALEFADKNGDINLACCARMGRILTLFPHRARNPEWKAEQLQVINDELLKMKEAGLEINRAYLQYVKFLLLREKPSEEFKIYCEQNRFSNLVLHMLCQQELKLTVM